MQNELQSVLNNLPPQTSHLLQRKDLRLTALTAQVAVTSAGSPSLRGVCCEMAHVFQPYAALARLECVSAPHFSHYI